VFVYAACTQLTLQNSYQRKFHAKSGDSSVQEFCGRERLCKMRRNISLCLQTAIRSESKVLGEITEKQTRLETSKK
jgi:hypothetical protein